MDKFTILSGQIDNLVTEARADADAMERTAEQHPCDDCTVVLRNPEPVSERPATPTAP